MGLTISVKNYDSFDIGYISFGIFRLELAKTYNKELGALYKRWIFGSIPYREEKPLSKKEFEEFKNLAGDFLIFLAHSDCEGSFTPSESRKIYKCIEKLEMDYKINERYHNQGDFNVLKRLKKMFYHSWKNRRRVIFS